MAEWLGSGLQIRISQFDSGRRLCKSPVETVGLEKPGRPSNLMQPIPALILVSTTSDELATLELIAQVLLEQRLAACVQISGPLTSHYRWAGSLTRSSEYLLTAKSHADLWPAIQAAIRSRHPYELPEIIAVRADASQDYHQWVLRETDAGTTPFANENDSTNP